MEHPADHRYPEMATPPCAECGLPLDRSLPEEQGVLCLVCGVLVSPPDKPSEGLPPALVERLGHLDDRELRAFLMHLNDFSNLEIACELQVDLLRAGQLVRRSIALLRTGKSSRVPWKPVTW